MVNAAKVEKADMTPMIDVVFLLIIFFMVVAQFSNMMLTPGIILPEASESIEDDGVGRRMIVNVTEGGVYKINGVTYSVDVLTAVLKGYTRYHAESDSHDLQVLIRADGMTQYGNIQTLFLKLQDENLPQVSLATLKPVN